MYIQSQANQAVLCVTCQCRGVLVIAVAALLTRFCLLLISIAEMNEINIGGAIKGYWKFDIHYSKRLKGRRGMSFEHYACNAKKVAC